MGKLRWLPLLYVALYLVVLYDGTVTARDWTLLVVAASAILVAGRQPLIALVTAIAATTLLSRGTQDLALVFAGVTLAELTFRRRGGQLAVGIAVLAVLVFTREVSTDVVTTAFRTALVVGVPVLIGEFLRAQQRLRASAAQSARTAERVAIARELHDLVAHYVASMVLRAGVARHVSADLDPRVTEALDDVHSTGTAALADLRNLVAVLRDQAEPGVEELRAELDRAVDRAGQAGARIDAEFSPRVGELDTVRGLVVLRFVQEGLTNTLKHAATAQTRVRVEVDDQQVEMEVHNDATTSADGDGHGLAGLAERIGLVGGVCEAGPDGHGWRLRASFPVRPR